MVSIPSLKVGSSDAPLSGGDLGSNLVQAFAAQVAQAVGLGGETAETSAASPLVGAGSVQTAQAAGGGSRPVQSDVISPAAQAAIEQTIGGPLRPGENTIDSLRTAEDVRSLGLDLSPKVLDELAKPGFDGRMGSVNGRSYAFAFEDSAAQSAETYGVDKGAYLDAIHAEESGQAAAQSRYPKLTASANEVVGEAVTSRANPEIQTLTTLNDLAAAAVGRLPARYGQSVEVAKQALGKALGEGGDVDAFVQGFSKRYNDQQMPGDQALLETAKEHLAKTGSKQSPEDFVDALEKTMAATFQAAAADILKKAKDGAPATS